MTADAYDPVAYPEKIRETATFVFRHLAQADVLTNEASAQAKKLSIFSSDESGKDGRLRDPDNLPSLGAVHFKAGFKSSQLLNSRNCIS